MSNIIENIEFFISQSKSNFGAAREPVNPALDDEDDNGLDGAPASMILSALEEDIASMKERQEQGALDEDDVLYQLEMIRDEAAAGNFDAAIKRAERSGNTSYVKGLEAARGAPQGLPTDQRSDLVAR